MKTNDSGVPFLSGSRTSSKTYRDNYDNIFTKKEEEEVEVLYEELTEHFKKDLYLVGAFGKIIFKTRNPELLDKFTDCLCDQYEENYGGEGHDLYRKNIKENKYYYLGCTIFGGLGVMSRGVSPSPDHTESFLKEYGEIE